MLLGVRTHTSTLHVLAEFGRYPLQLSWQALAEKYLNRLEKMENNRMLKQPFIADLIDLYIVSKSVRDLAQTHQTRLCSYATS